MLLAVACPVFAESELADLMLLSVLLGNQVVDTVESHAAVVTDDAAATVCVRQTGDDV